jgi:hypothetical protein
MIIIHLFTNVSNINNNYTFVYSSSTPSGVGTSRGAPHTTPDLGAAGRISRPLHSWRAILCWQAPWVCWQAGGRLGEAGGGSLVVTKGDRAAGGISGPLYSWCAILCWEGAGGLYTRWWGRRASWGGGRW